MNPLFRDSSVLHLKRLFLFFGLLATSLSDADMVDSEDYDPWETCALCHGYTGDSAMSKFPKLNGQKPAYLLKQIRDFQLGIRTNDGGQMVEMVSELSEEDMKRITSWFSSQDHPLASGQVLTSEELVAARNLFYSGRDELPSCASCHNNDNDQVPRLAGQHEAYVEKQLLDFRESDRDNDQGQMQEIAKSLSDDEVVLMSKYLSSKHRKKASKPIYSSGHQIVMRPHPLD